MNPSAFVPVAAVTRGGPAEHPTVESLHLGAVVALAQDGSVAYSAGDPEVPVFARSSLKPLFAVGMLRAGLEGDERQLALACASHNGGAEHLDVVRSLLARYGLTEADLRNTPGVPLGKAERRAFNRSGQTPDSLHQNCSGKHAAMLATAVALSADPASYLDHDGPVATLVRDSVERLTGATIDPATVTRDGCGAEVYPLPLISLARAYARLTAAEPGTPEHAVADAMAAHPDLIAGEGREATAIMRTIPGSIAKDGAEGFFALGLPGGAAVAVKIADGAMRAAVPAMIPALRALGVPEDQLAALPTRPVLGWGQPVGAVAGLST
ncbi:hypothetical protein AXF14_09185 [Actinomyces radicidentis]|uniref:Asparaginase n=1 Tax=Actinomyces radicidentis TaxID=111015 RepID=A0A109W2W4_ACTRD|nr:asparaginase [Actinomyces radicidentis]AMD87726.1 hypothetical protein AXF14_09185 [Actinomyces radicidentis]